MRKEGKEAKKLRGATAESEAIMSSEGAIAGERLKNTRVLAYFRGQKNAMRKLVNILLLSRITLEEIYHSLPPILHLCI